MEQGNWNVDEMLHWLDMKINREDRNIREQSKKMNENFLHFFELERRACISIILCPGVISTPAGGGRGKGHGYGLEYC